MDKPTKKTITHYEYLDIIAYIEEKYKIKVRDYYGVFSGSGQPWSGPLGLDGKPPYADFWHWLIHCNDHVSNGSYIWFPDDLPWGEVKDDPKCYHKNTSTVPKFVMEIMGLIEKEFGKEIFSENIWVEW